MKTLWSIGGHDPNAAAGIEADLLVAHALDIKCRTLIATFTAQSDQKVSLSEAVPAEWLSAQWTTLSAQEQPAAIKLGLLHDREQLQFLRDKLGAWPDVPVIADPVMASSSGHCFVDDDMMDSWRELLAPRVSLLTPNIPEAERLLGYPLDHPSSIVRAAAELRSWGISAVLIKGGHSQDPHMALDYFDDGQRPFWLHGKKVAQNYRGTGCSLASAIASQLCKGLSLREALVTGHAFLQATLQRSAAAKAPYLRYRDQPFALPGLNYANEIPAGSFPAIEGGTIGFYPIVPDLFWLKKLVGFGVPSIQLRIKDLTPDARRPAILEAVSFCRSYPVRLFINDFWEDAAEAGAYGVHLGQEDLDLLTEDHRQRLRSSGLRLGISTHSYEEASRAVALRPSYIALGPIFATSCKSMAFGPQGMERVKEWQHLCQGIPLVAIGGLGLEHAETLLAYGASGLSVITDILKAQDPESRTQSWLAVFQKQQC